MKRKFNEIWKAKEGSKVVWKVQGLYGIVTFKTKKAAYAWAETFNKQNEKYINEVSESEVD